MKKIFAMALISAIVFSCNKDKNLSLEDVLFRYDSEIEREASVWYCQYGVYGNSITYYFSKSYAFSEATGQSVKYTGTAIRCNNGGEFVYTFECKIDKDVIYIDKFTNYFLPLYGSDKEFFNETGMNYIKTSDGEFSDLPAYQIRISSFSENRLVCSDDMWGEIILTRGYSPVDGNKLLEDVIFENGETLWEHKYNPGERDDDVLRYCFYSSERNTHLGYMERRKFGKILVEFDVEFRIEYYSAIETFKHVIYFDVTTRMYGGDPDMKEFYDDIGFPYEEDPTDGTITPLIKNKYKIQVIDYNNSELVCNDEIWGIVTLNRIK